MSQPTIKLRNRAPRRYRNWWHEWIMTDYYDAAEHWLRWRQEECLDFRQERLDFAAEHPRPTLKAFLIGRAGQRLDYIDRGLAS